MSSSSGDDSRLDGWGLRLLPRIQHFPLGVVMLADVEQQAVTRRVLEFQHLAGIGFFELPADAVAGERRQFERRCVLRRRHCRKQNQVYADVQQDADADSKFSQVGARQCENG